MWYGEGQHTIKIQFCFAFVSCFREIAELHKKLAAKESKAQETALSVEMNAKEELRLALERSQQDARRDNEGLLLQVWKLSCMVHLIQLAEAEFYRMVFAGKRESKIQLHNWVEYINSKFFSCRTYLYICFTFQIYAMPMKTSKKVRPLVCICLYHWN